MSTPAKLQRLPPIPPISEILKRYNIRSRKSLSQNFLTDPRTLHRFANACGPLEGKGVVEIGAGPGGITRALLGCGASDVRVIERDVRFTPLLSSLERVSNGTLKVHIGDVRNFNMSKLFPEKYMKPWHCDSLPDLVLLGNLPFNISTIILLHFVRQASTHTNLFSFGRVPMALMFQKEIAERLVAPPNSCCRSRLSIFVQNWFRVRYLYTLSGGTFTPRPSVDVGVVQFTPLDKPYIDLPFPFVERVVTHIFTTKRKVLSNVLSRLFPPTLKRMERVTQLLRMTRLHERDKYTSSELRDSEVKSDARLRVFQMDMNHWESILFSYKEMCDKDPAIYKYLISLDKYLVGDGYPLLDSKLSLPDAIRSEELESQFKPRYTIKMYDDDDLVVENRKLNSLSPQNVKQID